MDSCVFTGYDQDNDGDVTLGFYKDGIRNDDLRLQESSVDENITVLSVTHQ